MEIHFSQLLFQFLNFGLLLFVLTKFLYKPILKILDQRAEKIDAGLLAAQKSLEAQCKLEELKKATLVKAELESQKIIESAKNEADKIGRELIAKAKEGAERLIAKEEAAFQARLKEQEQLLTQKTANFVIMISKSVLKDSLSANHQQEILSHQLKVLNQMNLN